MYLRLWKQRRHLEFNFLRSDILNYSRVSY